MNNNYNTKIIKKGNGLFDTRLYGYKLDDIYQNTNFNEFQFFLMKNGEKPNNKNLELYKLMSFLSIPNKLDDEDVLVASNALIGGASINAAVMATSASMSGVRNGTKEIDLICKFLIKEKEINIEKLKFFSFNYNDNSQYHNNEKIIIALDSVENMKNIYNFLEKNYINNSCIKYLIKKNKEFMKIFNKSLNVNFIISYIGLSLDMNTKKIISNYILSRLPVVLNLAIEQQENGILNFPFYQEEDDLEKNTEIKKEHIINKDDYFL